MHQSLDKVPLTFDELPSWYATDGVAATRRSVSVWQPSLDRRSVLRGMLGAGAGLGLAMIGQLPLAKRADAACVSAAHRDIKSSCHASYNYGCTACGPSQVLSDTCDTNGWHKYTGDYRNRPDQCTSSYDGWLWNELGCGCPSNCARSFRCHDGCKLISGNWTSTICRYAFGSCIC